MPETVIEFYREIRETLDYKGLYCFEVGKQRCNRLWMSGDVTCVLFLCGELKEDGDKIIRCDKCRKYFGDN